MKLLQEFLIINEANEKIPSLNIDGSTVELNEYEAERGYYAGRLLLAGNRHGPDEFGDDEDAHFKIERVSFIVTANGIEYVISYDLNNEDFLDGDSSFHKDDFLKDMTQAKAILYDQEDDEVKDAKTKMFIKSLVAKYVQQFDCLSYMYNHTEPKEIESSHDDGGDNFNDDDEVGQYYDGN